MTLQSTMRRGAFLLALVAGVSISVWGVRVVPASYHLDQRAGTVETYQITVLNDTDATEELSLYVGDWQRLEDGEHDWGVPVNSARWIFDRAFAGGETTEIVYSIQLPPAGMIELSGSAESVTPQTSNTIEGADAVADASIGQAAVPSALPAVWVGRTVEEIDAQGVATIRLTVQCNVPCEGLVLYETASQRIAFASIEDAGARFDSINRSNADWLSLSHERLVLEPGESRELSMTVDMPDGVSGTYWSAIFVQSQPQAADESGTRVVSIYRTAIKVYVTAFGTEILEGRVVDVQVGETSPLILHALFENTGNVELVVTGSGQVIDRTGTVVREFVVEEFKVLPGAQRIVSIVDDSGSAPLAADIYQAVVSFDYGGDNPVVGVRGFRIR